MIYIYRQSNGQKNTKNQVRNQRWRQQGRSVPIPQLRSSYIHKKRISNSGYTRLLSSTKDTSVYNSNGATCCYNIIVDRDHLHKPCSMTHVGMLVRFGILRYRSQFLYQSTYGSYEPYGTAQRGKMSTVCCARFIYLFLFLRMNYVVARMLAIRK